MISIVVPTHNRPNLLVRCVESTLRACAENDEIVIVDDGSISAAETLGARSSRKQLRVIRNTGARGAAGARNFGATVARGDIILFVDDDDVVLPDVTRRIRSALDAEPNLDFGFFNTVERSNDREGKVAHQRVRRSRFSTGMIPSDASLKSYRAGFGAAFWVRRELFFQLWGINPHQTIDEDTDFCCRLYAVGALGWYEAEPGVLVTKDTSTNSQLTTATPAEVEVQCYWNTYFLNSVLLKESSKARWFLASRAVRRTARNGADHQLQIYLGRVTPWHLKVQLWALYYFKRVSYRHLSRR